MRHGSACYGPGSSPSLMEPNGISAKISAIQRALLATWRRVDFMNQIIDCESWWRVGDISHQLHCPAARLCCEPPTGLQWPSLTQRPPTPRRRHLCGAQKKLRPAKRRRADVETDCGGGFWGVQPRSASTLTLTSLYRQTA